MKKSTKKIVKKPAKKKPAKKTKKPANTAVPINRVALAALAEQLKGLSEIMVKQSVALADTSNDLIRASKEGL